MSFPYSYIDDILVVLANAAADLYTARNYLYSAGDYIEDNEWTLAKEALYNSGNYFGYAATHLGTATLQFGWRLNRLFTWIGDNWPEVPPEYELTMSKILVAMEEALPHQPILFIGLVDAYRASIFDATFDERYFSDLIKKWRIWGQT